MFVAQFTDQGFGVFIGRCFLRCSSSWCASGGNACLSGSHRDVAAYRRSTARRIDHVAPRFCRYGLSADLKCQSGAAVNGVGLYSEISRYKEVAGCGCRSGRTDSSELTRLPGDLSDLELEGFFRLSANAGYPSGPPRTDRCPPGDGPEYASQPAGDVRSKRLTHQYNWFARNLVIRNARLNS